MERDLPDCILSLIFSKLSLKDQFKTCVLSKYWLRQWKLSSTHLNFDIYSTLPTDFPLFPSLQSQFTARVDEFMLNYQHATISSIRVKFPLSDDEDSDVIGRLISQGIAKGVKHIQLLFSDETNDPDFNLESKPYRFSLSLLSKAESLTYLHLENCLLVVPMVFSGLKNLTTLVLQHIPVRQDLLDSLFSNCFHLLDFTLDNCDLCYFFKIISLSLFHLKFVNCRCIFMTSMQIIAPNLSSLEYSSGDKKIPYLNNEVRPLSQFSYMGLPSGFIDDDMSCLKNLTTIVLDGIHYNFRYLIRYLFNQCLQLENVTLKNCPIASEIYITSPNLRHLNIIDCGDGESGHSMIYIDAKKLSSFEFSGHTTRNLSVTAPKLLQDFLDASLTHENLHSLGATPPYTIYIDAKNLSSFEYSGHTTAKVFWNAAVREENHPFPILHQSDNLAIILRHSQISNLKVLGRFRNLRQLELHIDEASYPFMKYSSILDVLMASPHLQKFSLTVRNSSWLGFLIPRKYPKFFHNKLEYVELHGCVCSARAIDLARILLRNVNSLKKITFNSSDRFSDRFLTPTRRWTKGSDSHLFDRNFIYNSLKDELKGECELIIL